MMHYTKTNTMNNYTNTYEIKNNLEDSINEAINYELNNGSDDSDSLYEAGLDAAYAEIENMVIYTSNCKEIVDTLNFDVFSDDNDQGEQPTSWEMAAGIALNEFLNNEINIQSLVKKIK